MIKFEEDELLVMAMYEEKTCQESIHEMKQALPYFTGDPDMTELSQNTIQKMDALTEEAYHQIDLESYKMDPEDDDAD